MSGSSTIKSTGFSQCGIRCSVQSHQLEMHLKASFLTVGVGGKEIQLLGAGVNHKNNGTRAVLKGAACYVWEVGRG